MNTQTAIISQADTAAIELVTNALTSEHSKRAYTKALTDFLTWRNGRPINKALVNEYRQSLTGSPASINLKMSAIRKLATEAADNGLLDQTIANGVNRVHDVTSHGVRSGNWLTKQQAQEILTAPQLTDDEGKALLKGYRDRAILAVMIGGGLRRSEVAGMTFDHIQQRDGRWVIVDMTGKGNRVRSVPIPSWVKLAIDEWADLAGINSGLVFRSIHKGGYIKHDSMTPQAIRDVVKEHAEQIGLPDLAPMTSAERLRNLLTKAARALTRSNYL